MRQRGKTPPNSADDEPVIQLTRGQMVLAVCGLMVGALFFYLLGVVTSRLEPVFNADQARQQTAQLLPAPDPPGTPPPSPGPQPRNAAPEGRQTSPRRDVLPPKDTVTPPAGARPQFPANDDKPPLSRVPAPAENAATQEEKRITVTSVPPEARAKTESAGSSTGPKPVSLPPKPDVESPAASAQSSSDPKAKTAESPAAAGTQSAPPPAAESGQQTDAAAQAPAPAAGDTKVTLEKIVPPPETLTPGPAAPPAQGEFYRIQLIAFSGTNRAKADAYAKEVRESTGLDVELEESSDGKYIRVYVGRYAKRADALKACEELNKQKRFAKAYVPENAQKAGN